MKLKIINEPDRRGFWLISDWLPGDDLKSLTKNLKKEDIHISIIPPEISITSGSENVENTIPPFKIPANELGLLNNLKKYIEDDETQVEIKLVGLNGSTAVITFIEESIKI